MVSSPDRQRPVLVAPLDQQAHSTGPDLLGNLVLQGAFLELHLATSWREWGPRVTGSLRSLYHLGWVLNNQDYFRAQHLEQKEHRGLSEPALHPLDNQEVGYSMAMMGQRREQFPQKQAAVDTRTDPALASKRQSGTESSARRAENSSRSTSANKQG